MPSIDYAAVRSRTTMQQVLALLEFQPFRQRGDELRGACPVHGGSSPRSCSFSADLAKKTFHCFSCGAGGNQLDLWATARQLSIYDGTLELCRCLGLEVPVLPGRVRSTARAR